MQVAQPQGPFLRLLALLVKIELHVALHDVLAPASVDEPLPPTTNPNYGEHTSHVLPVVACSLC